jgi:hypothetical protein
MDNGVEPPALPDVTTKHAVNDPEFLKVPRQLVRQKDGRPAVQLPLSGVILD